MKHSAGAIDCGVQMADLDTDFRAQFLISVQQKSL
jgi:hypothetical protein